jgi:hypothetical protein
MVEDSGIMNDAGSGVRCFTVLLESEIPALIAKVAAVKLLQ